MNAPTPVIADDNIDQYLDIASDFRYIMDPAEARRFIAEELNTDSDLYPALDFETTGLVPGLTKVRLSCFFHPTFGAVILDHFSCGPFKSLAASIAKANSYYVYNKKFEFSWFDYEGVDADLIDVDFLAKAKLGGYPSSFARVCKRDLKVDLDKTLQTSDWGRERLTEQQLTYGALDSVLTYYDAEYWEEELTDDQYKSVKVFNDCVPAVVEIEQTGMILDIEQHRKNIARWQRGLKVATYTLRRMVPKSALDNLNSKPQVSEFIKSQLDNASLAAWPKTGKREQLSLERKVIAPIAAKAPYPFSRWMNAYILYSYYSKYLSTYGDSLITKQEMAGRVHGRMNIGQAVTGRFSSSSPNMQNLPRKPYIRKCFVAPTVGGVVMVVADYSAIEVRVLAELSNDELLRQDVIYGDVHSSSASTIYHIDEGEFLDAINEKDHPLHGQYKELRSKAKAFTFQLLYGAGDAALSVPLKCSINEAGDAVRKWAERYPRAYGYRQRMFDEMMNTGFLPVVTGRTIYVRRADRSMPVAANYPVQGAAGDIMCRALHHLYVMNNKADIRVNIAASIHDEIVEYAHKDDADKAKVILEKAMCKGYLDVFPGANTDNLAEAGVGLTWQDAKQ